MDLSAVSKSWMRSSESAFPHREIKSLFLLPESESSFIDSRIAANADLLLFLDDSRTCFIVFTAASPKSFTLAFATLNPDAKSSPALSAVERFRTEKES